MLKSSLILAILTLVIGFTTVVEAKQTAKREVAQAGASKSLKDSVKKIREDDEGVVVLFAKSGGTSFYLRRSNPNFDALKKKLDESLKTKAEISVTYDSGELNILEVK